MCNLKSREVIEIKQNLSLELNVIYMQLLQIYRQLELMLEILQNNTPSSKAYTDPLVEHWKKSFQSAVFFFNYLQESSRKATRPIVLKVLLHLAKRFSNRLRAPFFERRLP